MVPRQAQAAQAQVDLHVLLGTAIRAGIVVQTPTRGREVRQGNVIKAVVLVRMIEMVRVTVVDSLVPK